ncbi:hypothetical protein SEA_MELBA_33 [Gordonia phage Melba]|nr:hypothetical protein SEA_MELBA_33 [Gordonia phage Melba]WPH57910.1 toxin [Gordonia phage RayTheFireFly]
MTEFVYLTVEQIIRINADQDGGVGVVDRAGIEASAARPGSGAFGSEAFPTIWEKAAAYVHGFATTQYFSDGNKRTAWLSAIAFLSINGRELPEVPEIEAETFVQAVAQKVFDTEDEPDATLRRAAEWFESKWNNQRVGPAIDPRLEYCYLAFDVAEPDAAEAITVYGPGMHAIGHNASYPVHLRVFVVGRLHWDRIDTLIPHVLSVKVVPDQGYKRITHNEERFDFDPHIPPSGHPHHHQGVMPTIFWRDVAPRFRQDCDATVEVRLDGEVIARVPLKVVRT